MLAEEVLAEKGGRLTAESLRSLMLQAGYSEDESDTAYCRRVLQETAGEG